MTGPPPSSCISGAAGAVEQGEQGELPELGTG